MMEDQILTVDDNEIKVCVDLDEIPDSWSGGNDHRVRALNQKFDISFGTASRYQDNRHVVYAVFHDLGLTVKGGDTLMKLLNAAEDYKLWRDMTLGYALQKLAAAGRLTEFVAGLQSVAFLSGFNAGGEAACRKIRSALKWKHRNKIPPNVERVG